MPLSDDLQDKTIFFNSVRSVDWICAATGRNLVPGGLLRGYRIFRSAPGDRHGVVGIGDFRANRCNSKGQEGFANKSRRYLMDRAPDLDIPYKEFRIGR